MALTRDNFCTAPPRRNEKKMEDSDNATKYNCELSNIQYDVISSRKTQHYTTRDNTRKHEVIPSNASRKK